MGKFVNGNSREQANVGGERKNIQLAFEPFIWNFIARRTSVICRRFMSVHFISVQFSSVRKDIIFSNNKLHSSFKDFTCFFYNKFR